VAKMIRVLVPLPQELLEAIDEARGLVPRAAWLRDAAKKHLQAKPRVATYRELAEGELGRPLTESEVVHHIDGNRYNNDPENLKVYPNQSEHAKYHAAQPRQRQAADSDVAEQKNEETRRMLNDLADGPFAGRGGGEALAAAIGVHRQTIKNWRSKKSPDYANEKKIEALWQAKCA